MKKLLVINISLIVFLISGCSLFGESQTAAIKVTSKASTSKIQSPKQAQKSKLLVKEFTLTAKQWSFSPSKITVNKGDKVILHIKSIDVTHGFQLDEFGISKTLSPGKTVDIQFVASKTGTFSFFCNVFCGSGHKNMKGTLMVK